MACAPVVSASSAPSGSAAPIALPIANTPPTSALPTLLSGASNGINDSGIGSTGRAMTSGQSDCSRGVSSVNTGPKLRAVASRALNGAPRFQRSRRVEIREVARYSSLMTVRGGIQAEIARVGMRTPEPSNRNPN